MSRKNIKTPRQENSRSTFPLTWGLRHFVCDYPIDFAPEHQYRKPRRFRYCEPEVFHWCGWRFRPVLPGMQFVTWS